MKHFSWLAFALVAGCGFGDNNVTRSTQDAGGHPATDACSNCSQPDAAIDAPITHACALLPQSGCDGATPACDLTAADDGSTACRAVTSQGTSNDHCAVDTACRAGYTCVHDGANLPFCSRFCAQDPDCTGTGSRCLDELVDDNDHPLDVVTCTNACDPYAQSGCPSGMGCLGFDDGTNDYTDCEYMGGKADGAACMHSVECTEGSSCVSVGGGAAMCEPSCIVGNDNTCDVDEVCDGFSSPLVIGGVEYGACQ